MSKRTHIVRYFAGGIGHIETEGDGYRVSFYGRRVAQADAPTLAEARATLRNLARAHAR